MSPRVLATGIYLRAHAHRDRIASNTTHVSHRPPSWVRSSSIDRVVVVSSSRRRAMADVFPERRCGSERRRPSRPRCVGVQSYARGRSWRSCPCCASPTGALEVRDDDDDDGGARTCEAMKMFRSVSRGGGDGRVGRDDGDDDDDDGR